MQVVDTGNTLADTEHVVDTALSHDRVAAECSLDALNGVRVRESVRFSGAVGSHLVDGDHQHIPAHAHDWPVLSIYLLGSYRNVTASGETYFDSPSVTLYRAGESHSNSIGAHGFEQLQIEFDPGWLGSDIELPAEPVRYWIGGRVSIEARRVAAMWRRRRAHDVEIRRATAEFMRRALQTRTTCTPEWLSRAIYKRSSDSLPTAAALARQAGTDAATMAEAYRDAMGEGLAETRMRKKVEVAATLLRNGNDPAAEVAIAAGFCDQSHMIRCFRKLLGRTPSDVRRECKRDVQRNFSNQRA